MTETKTQKKGHKYSPPRWGYCPVCFRERRFTVLNEMVPHRMWVSGFIANGNPNHPESHPYDYMKPCPGSGKAPLNMSMS